MRNRQLGVTLTGLIVGAVILILVAITGMKTLPAYLEFFAAKKLITQIANERPPTPAEARRAWDLRQGIQDITTVNSKDLQVTKEGNTVVISFAYRKEVPLFGNVGIYMDFAADSTGREKAPE